VLNLPNEIWKDIEGYEGYYEVSNLGRIKSLKTNHGKDQILIRKTYDRPNQYTTINFTVKGVARTCSVHRLVAIAFIPNPDHKRTVNHIDGNKHNNLVTNLEWATYSENIRHAYSTGLNKVPEGRGEGIKSGKTSHFHNVTYDPSKDRWIASVKVKGKSYVKRFPTKKYGEEAERLAALAVNELLDNLGLTNRPKNIL